MKDSFLGHYVLPIMAIALCSCGAHNTQASSAAKTAIFVDGSQSASNGENGQNKVAISEGESARYPADLPFAQYPESKVSLSIVAPGQASKSVNLETVDAPDKVVAYYQKWFTSNGWKIVQRSSTSGMAAIAAQSGDKQASIMSMPGVGASGRSSIQITLSASR